MDAYLEEELYDILTYCIQNSDAADFEEKKQRVFTIGKELYSDGGIDTMENIFYSIEFRIKDEIGKDVNPYRSWWRHIKRMEILELKINPCCYRKCMFFYFLSKESLNVV
ncbi:MAG: hypothetical protein QN778_06230 [Nitrososphaeraceae archaeon]|nr:hypothetical protein [Nitrososphaeraceae archaeon]